MSRQRWLFQPVDTWFFREARAHDAVGVGQLESQFPPPVSTLMGAVRTGLGDIAGIDWQRFAAEPDYFSWLGDGDQLGELDVTGPQLYLGDEPLYPAPADLLVSVSKESKESHKAQKDPEETKLDLSRLRIGTPVRCDLGLVALPELDGAPAGSKPVEGAWLTATGMARWQAGECPAQEELVWREEYVSSEPRLGIGRDNQKATVKEGLLYQTLHLRFHPSAKSNQPDRVLRIGLELDGVPDDIAQRLPGVTGLRLGGEGREARVEVKDMKASEQASSPRAQAGDRGLILVLDTPAVFNDAGSAQWCLPGFKAVQDEAGRTTHWVGSIAGVELKLVSVVMDRMQRVGGWDQRQRKPKAVSSRVAPGSLFYCELAEPGSVSAADLQAAIDALDGQQVGDEQAWGFGRIRVGRWC